MDKEEERLLHWLNRFIIGRPILVTPLLGLFFLFNFDSIRNTSSILPFYFLLGATWGLTFLYLVALRGVKNLNAFVSLQLVCDLFLITLLTGITGNVASPFSILYIVAIVSSALFFPKKGAVLVATSAILLLGTVTLIEALSPLLSVIISFGGMITNEVPLFFDNAQSSLQQNKETLYRLLLHAIAFYLIGIISSRFFNNMREKEIGLAKLRILHDDIVKCIPSGLVTTDMGGKITSFNHAASQIMGVSLHDALGAIWWKLFSWEELENQYKKLIRCGLPQRFEGLVSRRDGNTICIGATLSSLRNDRGESTGVIGTFQDLTRMKMLEEEMYHKRRLAAMGELAAGMAHEIRNPLASLSGSVQLLKNELVVNEDHRRLLDIAHHEADRLNAIITEFLLYAKPLPPRRQWTSLAGLLSESISLIKNTKEITEAIRIQAEPFPTPISCFIDPYQIQQVFWNVAINALQEMSEFGGILTISAREVRPEARSGDWVEIRFCDTGTGISKKNLPKIFDPFFTTKSSGSGLGLPIVQRIIEQHAGVIDVQSDTTGTTFIVSLPKGYENSVEMDEPFNLTEPLL